MTTKWYPTPEILEKIAELAEQRINEVEIAKAIGIATSTWWAKKREYPEIREVIENARRSKVEYVMSKLMKIIDNEDHKSHAQVCMYYLTRYDTDQIKQTEVTQTQLPTGFTWTIVTDQDVKDFKGDNE